MDAQEELAFLRSVAASQLQTIKALTLGCEKYGLTETTPVVRHLAAQDDEIERLRAELAEAKKFKDGMLDVLGGACPNDHRSTPFEEFKGCTPCLRAELAEAKAEITLLKTPNLVWDFDEPENWAVDSVADAVYQHIDWGGDIHVGDVVTFLAARKLSDVTIRITSVNDDGEVTFEAIDAAMAGGEK